MFFFVVWFCFENELTEAVPSLYIMLELAPEQWREEICLDRSLRNTGRGSVPEVEHPTVGSNMDSVA